MSGIDELHAKPAFMISALNWLMYGVATLYAFYLCVITNFF